MEHVKAIIQNFCCLILVSLSNMAFQANAADDKLSISSPVPLNQGLSSDRRLVTIQANNVVLKIPRNYFQYGTVGESELMFTLVSKYPGFTGIDDPNDPKYHHPFSLYHQYPGSIYISNLSNFPSARPWSEPYLDDTTNSPINTEFGLIKVDAPMPAQDYYVSPGMGEDRIVIKCSITGCGIVADLVPGLVIMYGYDQSMLPHWQEVHAGIMRLLRSFVVEK